MDYGTIVYRTYAIVTVIMGFKHCTEELGCRFCFAVCSGTCGGKRKCFWH